MDLATEPLRLLEKVAQIFEVVNLEDEARPAVNGPLDDVLGNSGQVESRGSGHAANMPLMPAPAP
jgi:hypothetical protein